ncbi:RAMP superfamily CRISPR-associated protein [Rhabdaerophilum sp. SD176]|uniref:RAMP superfamily CRISPR-associated protein n=1 Tax=Rhabdaerophilum sp. SD176 TaxID=2983548 RepID=UPI0024DFD077|nr:RAMP superfamily CRISPR-associated protein [Rhabdaerophilum sp. SD176]
MSHLYLARIRLRALSPLSIASGREDAENDVLLVRDANGLPMIPATALAGVLRGRLLEAGLDAKAIDDAFGRARQTGVRRELIERSRLTLTNAAVVDRHGVAIDGLCFDLATKAKADEILRRALAIQPLKRDHVRLSARHVVDGEGKFERNALPAGYRFVFDLRFSDPARTEGNFWSTLLNAIREEPLQIGGGTRRGYGMVDAISIRPIVVDLHSESALDALRSWPIELSRALPESTVDLVKSRDPVVGKRSIKVTLTPSDFWRIGGERRYEGKGASKLDDGEKAPQLVPYTEPRIVWKQDGTEHGTAVLEDQERLVVPATAIKGAIRHRMAFHANRITGRFADPDYPAKNPAGEPEGVRKLLGYVDEAANIQTNGNSAAKQISAQAGLIALTDAWVTDPKTLDLWHNGIDRFSGGVRSSVLYGEQIVFKGKLEFSIHLRPAQGDMLKPAREAFAQAVHDLINGRLAIGAGSSKGHGYMNGEISDAVRWNKWVEEGVI